MKGITYCGACADYDIKKHRCKRGAKQESNPQDKFFDDCPLPTVNLMTHERWIPVSERLPNPETEVMIVCNRNGRRFIATAIHEDGTLFEGDSDWCWNDIDEYGYYNEERDDYIIPEGWWESRCFTPDDVYNCPVDCEVTHWMPMPKMPQEVE